MKMSHLFSRRSKYNMWKFNHKWWPLASALSLFLAFAYSTANVAFAVGTEDAAPVTLDAVTNAYDQLVAETLLEIPALRSEEILKGLSQPRSRFSLPADEYRTDV